MNKGGQLDRQRNAQHWFKTKEIFALKKKKEILVFSQYKIFVFSQYKILLRTLWWWCEQDKFIITLKYRHEKNLKKQNRV